MPAEPGHHRTWRTAEPMTHPAVAVDPRNTHNHPAWQKTLAPPWGSPHSQHRVSQAGCGGNRFWASTARWGDALAQALRVSRAEVPERGYELLRVGSPSLPQGSRSPTSFSASIAAIPAAIRATGVSHAALPSQSESSLATHRWQVRLSGPEPERTNQMIKCDDERTRHPGGGRKQRERKAPRTAVGDVHEKGESELGNP